MTNLSSCSSSFLNLRLANLISHWQWHQFCRDPPRAATMNASSPGVAAAALLGVFLLQLLPAVSHASAADLSQLHGPAATNRKSSKLGRVRSPSPDLSMSGGGSERLSCGRHGFAPHINPVPVGIGGLSLGQPVKPVQKEPSLNWSGRNSPTGEMKGQAPQPYRGPRASDNGGLYHTPVSVRDAGILASTCHVCALAMFSQLVDLGGLWNPLLSSYEAWRRVTALGEHLSAISARASTSSCRLETLGPKALFVVGPAKTCSTLT